MRIIALSILVLSLSSCELINTYPVYIQSKEAQGIEVGSPIVSKGVEIGKVTQISVAGNNVVIKSRISKKSDIPVDCRLFSMSSEGEALKTLEVRPGKEPKALQSGDTLKINISKTFADRLKSTIQTGEKLMEEVENSIK